MSNHYRFDYFELNDSHFYSLSFRVVRFKVSENTYQTIITNLDKTEFSLDIIKELYQMRWEIETSFRELKYAIGFSHLHSKKMDYILQEIFAKLAMYNFCEMIILNVMISQKERRQAYQINFTTAINICKRYFRGLENCPQVEVERLIQ